MARHNLARLSNCLDLSLRAGTKPWRSLLGKRPRECECGTETSYDDLHRCTSNDSNVSEASRFEDVEPVSADGFVTPDTPVKLPATIGWAPCGPSPASVLPPPPELYDWESDGCRTPDQPIPTPTGPPPAPSRREHARPLMPDGACAAATEAACLSLQTALLLLNTSDCTHAVYLYSALLFLDTTEGCKLYMC